VTYVAITNRLVKTILYAYSQTDLEIAMCKQIDILKDCVLPQVQQDPLHWALNL